MLIFFGLLAFLIVTFCASESSSAIFLFWLGFMEVTSCSFPVVDIAELLLELTGYKAPLCNGFDSVSGSSKALAMANPLLHDVVQV